MKRKRRLDSRDPYQDQRFKYAIKLWYDLRPGIRLPVAERPPDHSRHVFCAFMFVCFDGQISLLDDYMQGKTYRGVTIALRKARERFYRYGLDGGW